jgi:hypothetical protein
MDAQEILEILDLPTDLGTSGRNYPPVGPADFQKFKKLLRK